MTSLLLDVSVLISLLDRQHEHHTRAHRLLAEEQVTEWLTCPTTLNGTLRIVSNPRYPNHQPVSVVCEALTSITSRPAHRFVPDDLSIIGDGFDRDHLLSSSQITDTYLLAMAVRHDAALATFDRRLATSAVPGGAEALLVLGHVS